MSNLWVDFFVARRIASRGVMNRIAVATAALAAAVMIVAVAVIMGFREEITSKIVMFTGHIRVLTEAEDEALAARLAAVRGVVSVRPYAVLGGVARSAEGTRGAVLRGVASESDTLHGRDTLSGRDAVVGEALARRLALERGDRLEMLFVEGERPRRELFRVAGTYASGLDEMDEKFVFAPLSALRRVDGYELIVDDLERLDEVAWRVSQEAGGAQVHTVRGDYPQLFDWLATHDVNAAVIVAIMMVVALVSMIAALLVMVLERIAMIGVLKTLGMRSGAVRRVFVIRAGGMLMRGLAIGNVLGVALALVQGRFGVVRLAAEGYMLSAVPVRLGWWIVALDAGFLAVIVALLIVPTAVVSRVTPEQSIRWT